MTLGHTLATVAGFAIQHQAAGFTRGLAVHRLNLGAFAADATVSALDAAILLFGVPFATQPVDSGARLGALLQLIGTGLGWIRGGLANAMPDSSMPTDPPQLPPPLQIALDALDPTTDRLGYHLGAGTLQQFLSEPRYFHTAAEAEPR